MRNKIGYVIIGILLGAIITSSIFLVRIKEMNERKEDRLYKKRSHIKRLRLYWCAEIQLTEKAKNYWNANKKLIPQKCNKFSQNVGIHPSNKVHTILN